MDIVECGLDKNTKEGTWTERNEVQSTWEH